ncbi:TetR/AcrR family transcriptional regulator, partial [Mycobacterium sp. ITM-2017-0098]
AQPPRLRIRAMLEALLDTVDQHRYLLQAMLEARATTPAIREVWDDAREAFVAGVAAVIDSERGDRAPEGAPASVVATMLLEFNDRLLERYTLG